MTKATKQADGKLTVREAIISVLDDSKRPMHYSEITARAKRLTGGLRGLTPEITVNSTLVSIPDIFVRVARGVYALSKWSVEQQAQISIPTLFEQLQVWGFRSYPPLDRSRPLEMKSLTVLIGPNSSGKSNLLDLLLLISEAASQRLTEGISRRNGMRSILWQNGADEFGWELIVPAQGAFAAEELPLTYRVVIRRRGESPVVEFEEAALIESDKKRVVLLTAERGHARFGTSTRTKLSSETLLPTDSELAIAQVRDPQAYPTLNRLREYLASWAVYREFLTDEQAKMRQAQATSSETQLQPHGENLITVLHQISNRSQYRPYYESIREILTLAFPDFEQLYFPAEPGASGKIGLAWKDRSLKSDLDVTQLSDGMLRFLALTTLLTAPDPPPLICIDEPEIGLHPALLHYVAGLLEKAAARTQIIATTHSSYLINHLSKPEYVAIVERDLGASALQRLDPDRLQSWLKDFTLGDLWLQGEIGGRP